MSNHLLNRDHEGKSSAGTDKQRPAQLLALTSIRFFLALAVLCYHYDSNFPSQNSIPPLLIMLGSSLAVPAFFCLSGFVLMYQYQHVDFEHGQVKYWIARVARVGPVYWLCLMLSLLFTPRAGLCPDLNNLPSVLVANFFLLQAWVPNKNIYWAFDPPAYTLSIEFFLYLLFPFVSNCIWKKRWIPLGLACLVLLVSQKLILLSSGDAVWCDVICPLRHVPQFILGVGTCAVYVKSQKPLLKRTLLTSPVVLSALELVAIAITCTARNTNISLVSFATLLFLCAFEKGLCARILSTRLLVSLGGMSYAVYLFHYLLIFWLVHNGLGVSKIYGPLSSTTFIACTLAVSFTIFKWIEQPLRERIAYAGELMIHKFKHTGDATADSVSSPKAKQTRVPILKAFVILLVCCAFTRLVALTPWLESAFVGPAESFMRPVRNSENVVFGNTRKLLKAYIYQGIDGLVLSSYWSKDLDSRNVTMLAVHLLDSNNKIIGQFDHPMQSGPFWSPHEWRDTLTIPNSIAVKADKIGLVVYEDPQKCWSLSGGTADWDHHRLLLFRNK